MQAGLIGVLATSITLTYAAVPAHAAPDTTETAAATAAASGPNADLVALYDVNPYIEAPDVPNAVEGGPQATLRNGPTLVNGAPFRNTNVNNAISLDGTDDYADTTVALTATSGFTASAWVKLDRVDRAQAVMSQNGTRVANFRIGLDAAGKWQFTMPRGDADTATADTVTGAAATVSKWTHLTGVYDAAAAKMTLYVNGVAATAVAHATPWNTANGVQWGRAVAAGAPTGYLDGTIAELRLYRTALDARRAGELTVNPATARADTCDTAQYLHAGGPAVKALASKVLAGSAYDRREAVFAADYSPSPLYMSTATDDTTYLNAYYAQGNRYTAWESVLSSYTIGGSEFLTFDQAPEYGEAMHRFLMNSSDTTWHNYFVRPAAAKPAQAELDQALAIAARMQAADPWTAPADFEVKSWSASQIARFLRFGGYPTVAPAEGSLEYRTEVESVKLLWAACEDKDPAGTYEPLFFYIHDGALGNVVDTARREWAAEGAGVASQRNTIVAAEAQTQADVRSSAQALVEAQGQAWIVGQLLKWKKYWLAQPKTASGYPTTAQFTKATTDMTTATNAINAQLTLVKTAVTSAQSQVTKVNTALTESAAVAKANGTPLYRGLQYAQQSSQVTKASAAAALSAQNAITTTLNAAKAANADGAALQSLAATQQTALQAEFRRVAAQEAAAQAKAAAQAAADYASAAATQAARAKADRATAEAAEAEAKKQSGIARDKRIAAEAERDKATAARQTASAERAKAASAKAQAEQEASAAASARSTADSAAEAARARAGDADAAEYRAEVARDAAVDAEDRRDEAAARYQALEARAAATAGSNAAEEARAAANDAKAAASDASNAAVSARAAANNATDAAVAARAAATQAQGAASRSRSNAKGAQAAADKTRLAYLTATAAAADALQAAEQAAYNADQAQAQADTAAASAVTARANAVAAQQLADEATAESARTAGAAYAASEAAFAARDSAAQAVTAALEAITMGTPYAQTDASAGFAVLVAQSSKTIAEQQSASAQIRADEAAEAAQLAANLAAQAQADAKVAAQAAADAAKDAAAAAQSALKARNSATAAAADAKAAQASAARCADYDYQAQIDAIIADAAASTAESQARLADDEATDAEKDAGAARAAATEAEEDATYAKQSATWADEAATDAEESAANANGYATEAEAAATRAEEQARLDDLAAREADMAAGGAGLPALGADDEAYLLAACGQPCVDEYNAALASANLDVLDWVKQNSGQILLDLIGYTDAKNCFTKGDVGACLWTAVNALSLVALVGKVPAVAAAIARVASGLKGFFRTLREAKIAIDRFKEIIRIKREAAAAKAVLGKAVKVPKGITLGVVKKHPKLADDGRYYLDEADTDTLIDPLIRKADGKWGVGPTITDIDRIKDGILWEEKTAVYPMTAAQQATWVQKQVVEKLGKYIIARPYVAGYEKAPIGLRFTVKGLDPAFKALVKQKVEYMRSLHPDADFRLEWAD